MTINCLPEGETLADLARRECAIGFDLRFCRNVAGSPDDRDTIICDPTEAEFATIYALTDLGETIAIHDADLTSAGADEVAAVAPRSSWRLPMPAATRPTRPSVMRLSRPR